jgi:hypothetical protein
VLWTCYRILVLAVCQIRYQPHIRCALEVRLGTHCSDHLCALVRTFAHRFSRQLAMTGCAGVQAFNNLCSLTCAGMVYWLCSVSEALKA